MSERTEFGEFVGFDESVSETRGGVTYTVTVVHDDQAHIDDDDIHREDRTHPSWEDATDEAYERAMEARAAWFRNEWHYVGLVVSAQRDGWVRDHLASTWGLEANYPGTKNEYLNEVAGELIDEAEASIRGLTGTHEPEDAMGGAIDAGDLLAFVAWLDLFRPDTFSDLWAEFQGTQDH